MRVMGVQEKERLIRDVKRLNKQLDEMRDRCSMYEVAYRSTSLSLSLSLSRYFNEIMCSLYTNLLRREISLCLRKHPYNPTAIDICLRNTLQTCILFVITDSQSYIQSDTTVLCMYVVLIFISIMYSCQRVHSLSLSCSATALTDIRDGTECSCSNCHGH